MKLKAHITHPRNVRCEIYTDIYYTVGTNEETTHYRLDVWKNGIGLADYLQDTLDVTKDIALREYGVPYDAWQAVEE